MTKPQLNPLEDRSVPATLTGTVFADGDGDGLQSPTEPGLGGVTVTRVGATPGTTAAETLTDSSGAFTFSELPTGAHDFIITPPVGVATPDAAELRFTGTVTSEGESVVGPSVGLRPEGVLRGLVFTDLNRNGVQDAGEPGLGGVPVAVDLQADGSVDYAVTTEADGTFVVRNVPSGNALVSVTPPAGYRRTQESVLSNVSVLTPSETVGLGVSPNTAISGRVTSAASGAGLEGVTVVLDRVNGRPGATTTTDVNGNYLFANVAAGFHTVTVETPPAAEVLTATGNPTLQTTVQLTGQPLVTGQDFTIKYAGSVTGKLGVAGDDLENPGLGVAGMPPASLQVDLGGRGEPVAVTAVRLDDGGFRIEGLPDGRHTLIVTPPTGTATTAPTRVQFTIRDGNAATVPFIPVTLTGSGSGQGGGTTPIAPGGRGNSQLLVGNGGGGGVQPYTFVNRPDGSLTPTEGKLFVTPAGRGGVRVVMADFDGDGVNDMVTGTGPGEPAMIRVFSGVTGAQIAEWEGFESKYTGGVNLAAADFNRDGKADIVVAADVGGGPRVRVFNSAQFQPGADPAQGKLIADFFAIEDAFFRGGARVATGDINGDGFAELVVSAGVGGGPRVAIFDGRSVKVGQGPVKLGPDFFAFEPTLRNGAVITVGDVNGDGHADLIAGAGAGGAPRVVVFSGLDLTRGSGGKSGRIADFYVNNNSSSRSGTTVTAKDIDGDGKADLIATDGGTTAYVVTSGELVRQFLNPTPTGPRVATAIDPFGDDRGLNLG